MMEALELKPRPRWERREHRYQRWSWRSLLPLLSEVEVKAEVVQLLRHKET